MFWRLAGREIALDNPVILGVLNVTPDSFSDGGRFGEIDAAIDAGLGLVDDGADIVDVGGESTRPGAEPVDADAEIRRVVPIIEGLVSAGVTVSIDTMKPEVAGAALSVGASVINDVTGFESPEMRRLAAQYGAGVVAMHIKGRPRTMQENPVYDDVVGEVVDHLTDRARLLVEAGCDPASISLDPGIGFGKTFEHNLELLDRLDELVMVGFPVVLGTSRKSFLGTITGLPAAERDHATATTVALAVMKGVGIFRVHDPATALEAATIAWTILNSRVSITNQNEST